MWHSILHFFGITNASGEPYLFWSGAGSDISEIAILGGMWHAFNCHEQGCWRPGHHLTVESNGAHVRRCKKHHQARHNLIGESTL